MTRAVVAEGDRPLTLVIPDTIQAVLAARMDQLPPEEKRLLQTAAVLGMEVSVPLLQAIAELARRRPVPGPCAPPGGGVSV